VASIHARASLARLRRALEMQGDEARAAEFTELVFAAWLEQLPAGEGLILERLIAALADAAEELGPEAEVRAIVRAGLKRERQLS